MMVKLDTYARIAYRLGCRYCRAASHERVKDSSFT